MESAHDKIAAGLTDAAALATVDPGVANAMGWAVARLMGASSAEAFAANTTEPERDLRDAMTADGVFLIDRLRERGFDVVKIGAAA